MESVLFFVAGVVVFLGLLLLLGAIRWERMRNLCLTVLAVLGSLLLVGVVSLVIAWVVMLLWNWVLPELFNFPEIKFWQSWALTMLIGFLKGS